MSAEPHATPRVPPELRPPAVVIVGFGLPGRVLAEFYGERNTPFCVIEANPEVCARNARSDHRFVCGDARDPAQLRAAGVETAAGLAVMIPHDAAVLEIIDAAVAVNPKIRILARLAFVSTGLEAKRRGAEQTIVAEQVVARAVRELAISWVTG